MCLLGEGKGISAPHNLETTLPEPSCSLNSTLAPRYLVGGEGAHMGQQWLPELRALVKDCAKLLWRELQDDLETLGLGALAALDEALPYLGVLPHLWGRRD